jgi:hypothetical protein
MGYWMMEGRGSKGEWSRSGVVELVLHVGSRWKLERLPAAVRRMVEERSEVVLAALAVVGAEEGSSADPLAAVGIDVDLVIDCQILVARCLLDSVVGLRRR